MSCVQVIREFDAVFRFFLLLRVARILVSFSRVKLGLAIISTIFLTRKQLDMVIVGF